MVDAELVQRRLQRLDEYIEIHCCPRQGLRMTVEALPEVLHVAECETKQSNASINGGLRRYGTTSESVQSIAAAGSPR